MVLVIQRPEIQPEQRDAPGAGHRLRGEAFATALDTQQQDAPWWIQLLRPGSVHRGAPLFEPFLEPLQPPHIRETGGIGLVRQNPFPVQQPVFRPGHFLQVVRSDRAVVVNGCTRQSFGLRERQSTEVLDEQVERLAVHAQLLVLLLLGPLAGHPRDGVAEDRFIGQLEFETGHEVADFIGYRDGVAHEDERLPARFGLQRHFLDLPDVLGVVQERMKIDEQVDPRDLHRPDMTQYLARLHDGLLPALAVSEPAQPLRHRPPKQPPPHPRRCLCQQLHDPVFLDGLDDNDGCARLDERDELLGFRHKRGPIEG